MPALPPTTSLPSDGIDPSRVVLAPEGRSHPAATIHRDDLVFSFSRASGPGGQNVNKVSSKAELRVKLAAITGLDQAATDRLRRLLGRRLTLDAEIVLQASASRSQHANRQACIDRLAALVTQAIVPPRTRRKTKPSKGAVQRRLDSKKRTAQKKNLRQSRHMD